MLVKLTLGPCLIFIDLNMVMAGKDLEQRHSSRLLQILWKELSPGSELKPDEDEFTETRRVKIPCMCYTGEPLAAYSADFVGKNAALKDKNRLLVNIFGDIWKCYAGPIHPSSIQHCAKVSINEQADGFDPDFVRFRPFSYPM